MDMLKEDNCRATQVLKLTGPWFWGRVGLFLTHWSPESNLAIMTVSLTSAWVRLSNLPIHFWEEGVMKKIGNSLGKFNRFDKRKEKDGFFSCTRLCGELYPSKDYHLQ